MFLVMGTKFGDGIIYLTMKQTGSPLFGQMATKSLASAQIFECVGVETIGSRTVLVTDPPLPKMGTEWTPYPISITK